MDIISVLTDWLIGKIGSWAKFISGVFAGDWKRAWEGLTGVVEQNRKTLENIKSKILQNWSDMKNKSITLFGDLRSRVQQIFSDLKNGLRSPLNAIIGFLNKLNSGIVTGVNTAIRALNRLKINVPDWVPGIGGKSFGFNISMLTAPKIPYLASGAVIPPRSEFLAVLGDQQRGTNIETPESLLRQIMREELSEAQSGGGNYRFTAQINRRTIFDEIIEEAKIRQATTGRNPFEFA